MSKRRRFLITSSILSLGFVGVQFLNDQNRFWAVGLLGFLTVILFVWSLGDALGKNMTLLTLILPSIFTIGVGMFWFLLPASIYTKIPIIIFYGIGIYVLSLTMNIYSVSAIRTIALLRAARGVGFVLTLLTSFLVFDAILSLRMGVHIAIPLVALFSLPLYYQGLWAVNLEKAFSKRDLVMALVFSLIMTEVAVVLSFWPVTVVVGSLFLTVTEYILLGLGQAQIEERLFKGVIREHLTVGIIVLIAMFFATHWYQ